jgi:hypothetical protein
VADYTIAVASVTNLVVTNKTTTGCTVQFKAGLLITAGWVEFQAHS